MELAAITLQKITQIFIVMIFGYILYKTKLINKETNYKLSDILCLFVTPTLIFISYQMEYKQELMNGWIQAFVLSVFVHILFICASWLMVSKERSKDWEMDRLSTIFTNCGFIGIPLVYAILGKEGVFYITAYMTASNLFIWTIGVMLISNEKGIKSALLNLRNPVIIAIVLGMICFFFKISLPELIMTPLELIGGMNTPLAMLVVGASMAQGNILTIIKSVSIYWISFLRLIAFPFIFILSASVYPFMEKPLISIFISSACPTGIITTLLAIKYNRDSVYATQVLCFTTLVSVVTIPAMIYLKSIFDL